MQSLSHHLRPAPYPYGLLTLRLLGKLGGKNRQFLRDPMQLNAWKNIETNLTIPVVYPTFHADDDMTDTDEPLTVSLPLPLNHCVDTIRSIALTYSHDDFLEDDGEQMNDDCKVDSPTNSSSLWECRIEDFDVSLYAKNVINDTRNNQALAGMAVLKAVIQVTSDGGEPMDVDENLSTLDSRTETLVFSGLLYSCMIDSIKVEATALLHNLALKLNRSIVAECLSSFLSEPSCHATTVGLDFLMHVFVLVDDPSSLLLDSIIRSLCEACCACSWGKQSGLRQAIVKMTSTLGSEWSRKYELILVNATLLAVKSVPRELSEAAVMALGGFINVCITLYGDRCHRVDPDDKCRDRCHLVDPDDNVVWDILAVVGVFPDRGIPTDSSSKYRPCEDVFKIIVYEMTSQQHLVR